MAASFQLADSDRQVGNLPPQVRCGQKAGLSLAEAQEQMERLKQEQAAGRTVTVSLAWKIEAGGDQK